MQIGFLYSVFSYCEMTIGQDYKANYSYKSVKQHWQQKEINTFKSAVR